MRRPVIGISGNLIPIENDGVFTGNLRQYIHTDYTSSVERAGGTPLLLPVSDDPEVIRAHAQLCDGIILSGGADVDPILYGEEGIQGQGYSMREIDVYDMELFRAALKQKKPVLGICKGLQALNVALGGTLYQDIGKESSSTLCHLQSAPRQYPSHNVSIREGSMLSSIIGSTMMVNSFHHQAVKDLAAGLSVAATSSDGLVEAVEMEGHPVLAVQWHPEMMAAAGDEGMLKIFKHFIDACMNRF